MKQLFTLLLMITSLTTLAQQNILKDYISEAFQKNQGLQAQQIQLEQSLYALKEAHALFMPNISFNATYSKADGGRSIELPVGDLLNGVYKSLNQLTNSASFPKLQNESVLLNPDNFYDAHFRTTLPLLNEEIYYNEKIKKEGLTQQKAAINVYKRELVKEIRIAYYKYYQADKSVAIYKNALALITENIRVNQSLLKNGVRNSTALTRSETEREKMEASITHANSDRDNLRAYLNFLMNRSLETAIVLDTSEFFKEEPSVNAFQNSGMEGREEIQQLQSAVEANEMNRKMLTSYMVPKVNTYIDLGSQAFNFQYNNKTQYYFWGISLNWDLFAGGLHTYRIRQAEAGKQVAITQLKETSSHFQLQLVQSNNNLNTAISNYHNAKAQLSLAEKYYTDQLKTYKAGELLYIELLDALTQLINGQLQVAVTRADVQIALAELERNTASYPINN